MKIPIPKRPVHVESGTYKVIVVEAIVVELSDAQRQQLRLTAEITTPGRFSGCHFFHHIMLDGTADYYVERLLKALHIPLTSGEFDSNDLISNCLVMTIENKLREGGLPNLYPDVKDIISC